LETQSKYKTIWAKLEQAMRHLKSLREYIEALSAIGESINVNLSVDLDLEMGAICRRCYETGAAAPLFSNIPGALAGSRVLGAPVEVGCFTRRCISEDRHYWSRKDGNWFSEILGEKRT
jgi:hypothetical protein